MTSREAHAAASDVTAEQGEVLIDGPDGVAISMTPEAAKETAKRLAEGAKRAVEQREEMGDDPPG